MTDHTHDVRDLSTDVAPAMHEHDERDLRGVAAERHNHTAADLSGVPSAAEFTRLQEQVLDLAGQTSQLTAQLLAEREVGAAVAQGADTTELIAAAIDQRASVLEEEPDRQKQFLGRQFRRLAAEIRGGATA